MCLYLHWGLFNEVCQYCRPRSDPDQTAPRGVQTQIRLLLEEQSDQGLHCLPFHLLVWTRYSMVEPHSSNFRVITTNFLGVRIFRKFTVAILLVLLKTKLYKLGFGRNITPRRSYLLQKISLQKFYVTVSIEIPRNCKASLTWTQRISFVKMLSLTFPVKSKTSKC